MDENDANVLGLEEDSVDIYDGLDISSTGNTEKSSPGASRLKDSLDLYEELVTEEQQSRESAFSELKSRFQAAQKQMNELHGRLKQMELQNSLLNTENYRLKKNISALLRTARLEVSRKDAAIQRLTQQSEKSRHHHRPHINNLGGQKLSGLSPAVSSRSRPPPSPPSIPLPPAPLSSSLPQSRSLLPPASSSHPPPLPPLPAFPPRETVQPSSKERRTSTNQLCGSFNETKALQASSHRHSKGFSSEEGNAPDKQTEYSTRNSISCPTARHGESEKHKYKHKEHKHPESTERRHRTVSDPNKDSFTSEKNECHNVDRERGRRHDSKSYKSRDCLSDEGRHKSERIKKPPPEASSDNKGKNQDQAKRSTKDSEDGTAHSCKKSQDHIKTKTRDQHNRGADSRGREKDSSSQHEHYGDSSKDRTGDRLSKDCHRKDRRHDDSGKKHRRSTSSEKCKEHKKQKSNESVQSKAEVCNKARKEKANDSSKRTSEKPSITENSPNRKLCFMETLNLTLSPIKKPVLPIDGSQDGFTTVDELVENGPDKDLSSQSNIEDMCVIDGVVSCELETELEEVAKQSSNISKSAGPEKTQTCDEKDQNQGETPAADKRLQQTSVQMSSKRSLDAAVSPMTVHVTNRSPESASLKASSGDQKTKSASDIRAGEGESLVATDGITCTSGKPHKEQTSSSFQKVNLGSITDRSGSRSGSSAQLSCSTPKAEVHEGLPVDSDKEGMGSSPSRDNPDSKEVPDEGRSPKMLFTVPPQDRPPGPSPPRVSSPIQDAVSSTISLESLPQEGLSLPEAIYILTQTSEDTGDSTGVTTEPSSSTSIAVAVSKVSSTTECTSRNLATPNKSFSPGNSSEPSSSVPVPHDEDSMMRTLSNLKRIPDAISPLRSPIRSTRRSRLHAKPGHVKSLERDFSSTDADANLKKLDVNKENKHPGSPAQNAVQADLVSELPPSPSSTELEEGEILSESDERASGSPLPATKKPKLVRTSKNKPSPKTLLKRTSKEASETSGVSTISPKNRFKTVCPAATGAAYSTVEEVMETFKLVRAEIRKKYMKLHKTFPRKSFYGVMNNFQESFVEFVAGAHFDQISSRQEDLKSKLRELIVSVFSKVCDNGIVKRIFEQQATDLKQKLWDFVDVQVDYLFRDIYTILKTLYEPSRAQAEDNVSMETETNSLQSRFPPKEAHSILTDPSRVQACPAVPYRTGLGSRGKDIRITRVDKDKDVGQHPTSCPNSQPGVNIPSSPEKSSASSLVVSQNVSLLDKTDFELLTEQQASSLTFNLVRDTQMGEIFKCLLQGSDLLETSAAAGDATAWSLGTPRKDGDRFSSSATPRRFDSPSKLLFPKRFDTPSKFIATWPSVSPRKTVSPRLRDHAPLNPALFDESCLLEVPSANRAMLQTSSLSQRMYSMLAEDLAVSLTIPSPLKSDGHLSFLHPPGVDVVSTPESVLSAHISEDAVMDGEDAAEQDIHLALDSDDSSCSSISTVSSEARATPFMFKPDLPMRALVLEKSNDHFIVKICQAAKGAGGTLTAEDSLSQTPMEDDQQHGQQDGAASKAGTEDRQQDGAASKAEASVRSPSTGAESLRRRQAAVGSDNGLSVGETSAPNKGPTHKDENDSTQQNTSKVCSAGGSMEDLQKRSEAVKDLPEKALSQNSFHTRPRERHSTPVPVDESTEMSQSEQEMSPNSPSNALLPETGSCPHRSATVQSTRESPSEKCEGEGAKRRFSKGKEDDRRTPETGERDCGKSGKRKKHQEKSKAKRSRREEERSAGETGSDGKDKSEPEPSPTSVSYVSLHAKNVIRKKGEVVTAWTRDEDRAILTELKAKGASRETFAELSEKLDKPPGQVAQRFYQLMKLFKKMDT
ncbi:CASP8-associated protein 2 [Brachionichthys hirsutus]|uniref:CASP8-associated protein 2 n=1 Tax=Brachionichthys hirsutus TaxID=412623 RepID=UPI0036050AD4